MACSLHENPSRRHFLHDGLPYLILPPRFQTPTYRHSRGFLSMLDGKVYDGELPKVEEVINKGQDQMTFKGCTQGWIVAVGLDTPSIYLIKPTSIFTGVGDQLLKLPPMDTFPHLLMGYKRCCESGLKSGDSFIDKIILSASPTNNNYVAVAIFDDLCALAFCKGGDRHWTAFGSNSDDCISDDYSDIIFYKDKLYAVDYIGSVYIVPLPHVLNSSSTTSLIKPVLIATPPKGEDDDDDMSCPLKLYLVESSGELLLVRRHTADTEDHYFMDTDSADCSMDSDSESEVTSSYRRADDYFEVFRMNMDSSSTTALEGVKTLGDHVLFLGYHDSLSLPSHSLPGCKGNCIYFTEDYPARVLERGMKGSENIRVFDYESKAVSPLSDYEHIDHPLFPPPIWLTPNACG